MLNHGLSYWASIGTLYLIILTYQDLRHNMTIDDRKNYFMMGVTIMILSHIKRNFTYLLAAIILIMCINWLILKFRILGDGDASAFIWIFYGYVIISPFYFLYFALILVVVTIIYAIIKKFVIKYDGYTPYFPAILVSFISMNILFKIY